jgi:hypothetical protein
MKCPAGCGKEIPAEEAEYGPEVGGARELLPCKTCLARTIAKLQKEFPRRGNGRRKEKRKHCEYS